MEPREVAAEVVSRPSLDDLCESPQVAGPGFINLRLKTGWLADELARRVADERLGVAPAAKPRTTCWIIRPRTWLSRCT